jgi:hypothetical protein
MDLVFFISIPFKMMQTNQPLSYSGACENDLSLSELSSFTLSMRKSNLNADTFNGRAHCRDFVKKLDVILGGTRGLGNPEAIWLFSRVQTTQKLKETFSENQPPKQQ